MVIILHSWTCLFSTHLNCPVHLNKERGGGGGCSVCWKPALYFCSFFGGGGGGEEEGNINFSAGV